MESCGGEQIGKQSEATATFFFFALNTTSLFHLVPPNPLPKTARFPNDKQARVLSALLPRRGREGARRRGDSGRQRRRSRRGRQRRRRQTLPPPRLCGLRGALPAGRAGPAQRRAPAPFFEGV